MLDQIIVGGATSLTNLIIHAVLLAAVVRTVRRLSVREGEPERYRRLLGRLHGF